MEVCATLAVRRDSIISLWTPQEYLDVIVTLGIHTSNIAYALRSAINTGVLVCLERRESVGERRLSPPVADLSYLRGADNTLFLLFFSRTLVRSSS